MLVFSFKLPITTSLKYATIGDAQYLYALTMILKRSYSLSNKVNRHFMTW